jgi:hypothetical protein
MVTKTATPLREEKEQTPVRTARCQHHWMIGPPESRTSDGECLLCQARKTFPNYLSDCLIENDREKFDEWLAKQGRRKRRRGNSDLFPEIEEGV